MFKLFATLALIGLTACTAPAFAQNTFTSIQAGHSGAYFDPSAGGEGLQLNVIEGQDEVFGTFYTYSNVGDSAWLVFQGEIRGAQVTAAVLEGVGVPGMGSSALLEVGEAILVLDGDTFLLEFNFGEGNPNNRAYSLVPLTPRLVIVEEDNCVSPQPSPINPLCQ